MKARGKLGGEGGHPRHMAKMCLPATAPGQPFCRKLLSARRPGGDHICRVARVQPHFRCGYEQGKLSPSKVSWYQPTTPSSLSLQATPHSISPFGTASPCPPTRKVLRHQRPPSAGHIFTTSSLVAGQPLPSPSHGSKCESSLRGVKGGCAGCPFRVSCS